MNKFICLSFFVCTLISCAKVEAPKKAVPGPQFNLPPTKKLTTAQRAEAMDLYVEFMTALSSTSEVDEGMSRNPLSQKSLISNLLKERCQITRTESQQGQTIFLRRELVSKPPQACPATFLESQVLAVSGHSAHVQAKGTLRSQLTVIGPDLVRLTDVDAYEFAGAISLEIVKTSESSSQIGSKIEQNGSVIINGRKLSTLQQVQMSVVNTVRDDQVVDYGKVSFALGLNSSFGWLVLFVEKSEEADGKVTWTCKINDEPISSAQICQSSLSYVWKNLTNTTKQF